MLEKNENGWWLVQIETTKGWAPASYLEPIDQPEEQDDPEPIYGGTEQLPSSFDAFLFTFCHDDKRNGALGTSDPFSKNHTVFKETCLRVFWANAVKVFPRLRVQTSESVAASWNPRLQNSSKQFFLISGEPFLTLEAYEAEGDDELSFDKGAIVDVLHKHLDGWWVARWEWTFTPDCLHSKIYWKSKSSMFSQENRCSSFKPCSYNGKIGYLPANYLKPYCNENLRPTESVLNRRKQNTKTQR